MEGLYIHSDKSGQILNVISQFAGLEVEQIGGAGHRDPFRAVSSFPEKPKLTTEQFRQSVLRERELRKQLWGFSVEEAMTQDELYDRW